MKISRGPVKILNEVSNPEDCLKANKFLRNVFLRLTVSACFYIYVFDCQICLACELFFKDNLTRGCVTFSDDDEEDDDAIDEVRPQTVS